MNCAMRWFQRLVSWCLAVFVTTLLNLMDAVTYGRLLFPTQVPLFSRYDFCGISMYLLCTSVSQLIISLFSSFRKGATGCGMIESIPFFHAISMAAARRIESVDVMMSTILFCYACVAMITALIFLGLALLNLDRLIHKFPRVVLVGLMGGIGLFLIITGMEIALNESVRLDSIHRLFASWVSFGLWSLGSIASIVALYAEMHLRMPFMTPIISFILLIGFYSIVLLLPYSLDEIRELGWLLRPPEGKATPLEVYSLFSLYLVDWPTVIRLLPIIFGAALFGSLHVPINVPSFARLTNQAFSMKRELFTQSLSNAITAIVGFVPNYFVYTNSLLFLRAGGTHRVAGIILSISTLFMLFYGLGLLGYIPTVIVMFLVLYLGICLVWEAVYESLWICSSIEYATIIMTMIFMQSLGFLSGMFIGVALSGLIGVYSLNKSMPFIEEDERPEVASPALESLYKTTLDRCIIISYSGYLYFGNCVEELHRLAFTSLDCSIVILDFRRVMEIDLNAREGILAMANSGLQNDGTILVCLGVHDEPLRRNLTLLGGIFLGSEGPHEWLHKILQRTVQQDFNATEEVRIEESRMEEARIEETRILLTTDYLPCLETDLTEYDRHCQIQRHLIKELRPHAKQVHLHQGEPIKSTSAILIITEGKLRRGIQNYTAGAWLYWKRDEEGQPAIAVDSTSCLQIEQSILHELSAKDKDMMEYISFYL